MINQRGQSLVEMAIITPILLFMLLGLFEVGYALHNDLIVTDTDVTGYDKIVNHSIASAAGGSG